MPEYDNKNTGILFKNDEKKSPTHPDYSGSYTDGDGREYFLDAWIKEGKKGKFMSLRTKLKQKKPQQQTAAPVRSSDDCAPF